MTRGTGPRDQQDSLDPARPVPGLLGIADTLAAATTDYRVLLRVAAQAVAASLGDAAVLWVLDDEGQVRPSAFHHDNPEARRFMAETVNAKRHLPSPGGLLELALRSDCPVLFPETSFGELGERIDAIYRPYYRTFGLSSLLMIPLRARTGPLASWASAGTPAGRRTTTRTCCSRPGSARR